MNVIKQKKTFILDDSKYERQSGCFRCDEVGGMKMFRHVEHKEDSVWVKWSLKTSHPVEGRGTCRPEPGVQKCLEGLSASH
jgi:hypothetical protein